MDYAEEVALKAIASGVNWSDAEEKCTVVPQKLLYDIISNAATGYPDWTTLDNRIRSILAFSVVQKRDRLRHALAYIEGEPLKDENLRQAR